MADAKPGFTAIKETEEIQLTSTGPDNNHKKFLIKADIKSTVTDSGNTPTTTLRGGLVMGTKASDGMSYKYDGTATDGTQVPAGIVPKHLSMLDRDGTVEDKMSRLLTAGILKNASVDLPNYDKEVAAVLARTGFTFAQLDPHGSAFGLHFKGRYFKSGAYTVVDADHGCLFATVTSAATFTMPTLATVGRGFQVAFFNNLDATMIVTAAADTILYDDTAGGLSTTLTWSTANQKMGASVVMTADYDGGGTLRWYPTMIQRTVVAS